MSTSKYWRAAHREGIIINNDNDEIVVDVALFDSGSSNDNFISKEYLDEVGEKLKKHLVERPIRVRVANGKEVQIKGYVPVTMQFKDCEKIYSAKLKLYVLDGLTKEVIIGLPAICEHFAELFCKMVQSTSNANSGDTIMHLNLLAGVECQINYSIDDFETDYNKITKVPTRVPWGKPNAGVAPEDKLMPEPCSFGGLINFMEMSVEEAEQEYLSKLEERIHPEFAKQTKVLELLRTLGMEVFVPKKWTGIKMTPLKLKCKSTIPDRIKPKNMRRVPPKLYDRTKQEFERMLKYFYKKSMSPYASPIVVAPKATKPFIRICGDYRVVNLEMESPHFPIPDVIKELHKAAGYKVFVDLDICNAFHGIPLDENTSALLSVQTPWGQFEPKFLPEGVSPASGVLMMVMSEIFSDYTEWMIVIFDNMLILANDYNDAYTKLELVLIRCKEYNVVLKLSKSKFGYSSVEFFGYLCQDNTYALTQERKESVNSIIFPEGANKTKQMQRFLGAAVYFKPFIVDYSQLTHRLNDMTKKDFDWTEANWKVDYRNEFETFKKAILKSLTLYHPDYNLRWLLMTDASDYACGGVLIQIAISDEGVELFQVIALISKKFTANAMKWSIIDKECFGAFYSIYKLSYYVRGKHFTLLTDHANLKWMEQSEVDRIVRMRVYMQNFQFDLLHFKGKLNKFADWLSRQGAADDAVALVSVLDSCIHCAEESEMPELNCIYENGCLLSDDEILNIESTTEPDVIDMLCMSVFPESVLLDLEELIQESPKPRSAKEAFDIVHNGRMGHHGLRRTWLKLCKVFPGHGISIETVRNFIDECALCQKLNSGMSDSLQAPVRALDAEHCRHFVGFDTLTVSPPDAQGHCCIHVVKQMPARLIGLYPAKDYRAEGVARALFHYFVTYGISEVLISDPGSNITAEVVQLLLKWFGVRFRVSLTNRHESNMVERSHRELLRFLQGLVHDERLQDSWGDIECYMLIQFILNDEVSSETGLSPFQYVFGTVDIPYFRLGELTMDESSAAGYVSILNENLQKIRAVAMDVQRKIQDKRKSATPTHTLNEYQPGDLVLLRLDPTQHKPNKLYPRFKGPYEVVSTYKADVTCIHVVMRFEVVLHMSWLKPFFGTPEQAYRVAQIDFNQYTVVAVIAYRGDPEVRSRMEFQVQFEDGSLLWLPWSQDIASTSQFQSFCEQKPQLFPLLFSAAMAKSERARLKRIPIEGVSPGQTIYVDLRAWGSDFYDELNLPNCYTTMYVVECSYVRWAGRRQLRIDLYCPLFQSTYEWSAYDVHCYGRVTEFDPSTMVLVDAAFCQQYPNILL